MSHSRSRKFTAKRSRVSQLVENLESRLMYSVTAPGASLAQLSLIANASPPDTQLDMPDLLPDYDDGESSEDNITSLNNSSPETALTFTIGNTQEGDHVFLFVDGFLIGDGFANGETATISTDGFTPLPDGEVHFTAALQPEEGQDPVFSDELVVTIDSGTPMEPIELTKPTAVDATDDQPGYITVVWEPVEFAEGYNIFRGTTNKFSAAEQLNEEPLGDSMYDDFDVTPGVKYFYFVTATAGEEVSPVSTAESGVVPLDMPQNIMATSDLSDRVTLTWDPVDGATSYTIFRSESEDAETAVKIKGGVSTETFDDLTAKANHYYYYWVKAVCTASTSEISDSAYGQLGLADTTITVGKFTSTISYGKPLTINATLKANQTSAPAFTGDLQIINVETTEILTISEIKGKGAALVLSELPVGTYTFMVHYDGDEFHNSGDSQEFSLTVKKATTSTVMKASVATVVSGQELTLTATVNSAIDAERSGEVTFYDGEDVLDVVTLESDGTAAYTFTPTVGSHKFKAVYSGDDNFAESNSSLLSKKVAKAKTSVTLAPSASSPITVMSTFDLTATIAITAPGAGDPTGMVTFKDNGKVIATVAVVGGEATLLNIAYDKTGVHRWTVTYSGDENFLLDKSPTLVMKVVPGIA